MNTTDNQDGVDRPLLENPVTKDDAKKMRDEYGKGETIDNLADAYGYSVKEVEAVVVDEVPETEPLPTQESQDVDPVPSKKGK